MNKSSAILCSLIQVSAACGMEQSVGEHTTAQILYGRMLNKAQQLLHHCRPALQQASYTSDLLQSYCPGADYLTQAVSLLQAEPLVLQQQSDPLATLIFAPLACKIDLDRLAQKLHTSERAGIVSEARKNVFLRDIEKTLSYAQKIKRSTSELIQSLSLPHVDDTYVKLYREYTGILHQACQEVTRIQELSDNAKTLLEKNLVASPRQSKRHTSD